MTQAVCVLQPRPRERLLENDGLAAVGEVISPGDILINKELPQNTRDLVGSGNPQVPHCRPPCLLQHAVMLGYRGTLSLWCRLIMPAQ